MSRKAMFRRLDRIQAKIPKTTLFNDLMRVAGKTQEQANADLVQAYRLTIDAADLPATERQTHLQRLAEWEELFAIREREITSSES